ncbi:hypothetical protein HYPSUDRAFT_204614 [Hypholoma sublateritium FD-334 SS-4]|uniref:Uncharacterized protein n=1 Tax=Hypholoma sublateritium (strain FD-334 SS-4) TaxID=945553 RepID=A0A0D2KXZ7_HYPSF|nr:hypothetical protein HYPSUDRAFT_204614 [Hypholoma sublateritium FD-334 SS-4]
MSSTSLKPPSSSKAIPLRAPESGPAHTRSPKPEASLLDHGVGAGAGERLGASPARSRAGAASHAKSYVTDVHELGPGVKNGLTLDPDIDAPEVHIQAHSRLVTERKEHPDSGDCRVPGLDTASPALLPALALRSSTTLARPTASRRASTSLTLDSAQDLVDHTTPAGTLHILPQALT